MEQIYYANSAYSLMSYLLQLSQDRNCSISDLIDKTLFVIGSATQNIPIPDANKIIIKEGDSFETIYTKIKGRFKDKKIPVYLNIRAPFAENILKESQNVLILSDGLSDKDTFPDLVKKDQVKELFSTKEVLFDFFDKKITLFDINKLWERSLPKTKEDICSIFQVSSKDLESAVKRTVILVTQPLSEDNMYSEDDKIELYKRIVDEYDDKNIIIKPHPREKTQWNKIFPNTPIIPKQIPIELLVRMMKSKNLRIATFFSTAAIGNLSPERVEVYAHKFSNFHAFHPGTLDKNGFQSLAVSDVETTFKEGKKCIIKELFDPNLRFKIGYKKQR